MQGSSIHRRTSSGSTIKAAGRNHSGLSNGSAGTQAKPPVRATLWIHDDNFSPEDVLLNEAFLEGTDIREGNLIEIFLAKETSDVRDFQSPVTKNEDTAFNVSGRPHVDHAADAATRYLCVAKHAPLDLTARQTGLQVSVKSNIANAFGLRPRSQVWIIPASFEDRTASHVEFNFRDAYLARSDMWRLVGQELAGRTIYTGQKITFLGTIKLTVKSIHVQSHKVASGYFSGTTIPIFRSEAARYVLFIQMSSEMWDFDSEGNGEIMFNRVINGFLPDLFKRWTDLDVRHLVSIVMFGRLEYDRFDLARNKDRRIETAPETGAPNMTARQYQDFYRVVVTDMASAQWTTILNELKKDFRVFLRDISLHTSANNEIAVKDAKTNGTRIAGRPSTALKGNILEAINIASTQFANDYVDRDLIRTGVSIVVISAGTGVFEVNRDLLNLTSQNLTNNGVGIDIVCLSRMPLHSVPLFKYRNSPSEDSAQSALPSSVNISPRRSGSGPALYDSSQPRKLSPALSSITSNSLRHLTSYITGQAHEGLRGWCFGIPQWVDLSYWSAEDDRIETLVREDEPKDKGQVSKRNKRPFVPRVRMYEIQMMGLMELGLADMSIPFMSETQTLTLGKAKHYKYRNRRTSAARSLSHSPTISRKLGPRLDPKLHSQGLLSTHAKALGDIFERMERYDSMLFRSRPGHQVLSTRLMQSSSLEKSAAFITSKLDNETQAKVDETSTGPKLTKVTSRKAPNGAFRPQLPSLMSGDASEGSAAKQTPETPKANRNLSYSLRGLAPPVRSVPSTEVNTTNISAQPAISMLGKSRPTVATSAASIRSVSTTSLAGEKENLLQQRFGSPKPTSSNRPSGMPSKPISINTPLRKHHDDRIGGSLRSNSTSQHVKNGINDRKNGYETEGESGSERSATSASDGEGDDSAEAAESWMGTSIASSVTRSNLPYVRNVNASNPLKRHPERESYYGRWQHLYPRKPRAAIVKWRSLCTPASVPLTSSDFPSMQDLQAEYESTSYDVHLEMSNDMLEVPESRDTLLREMLALRFSHGYQLVVGPTLVESVGPGTGDSSSFFTPGLVRPDGSYIFLSMANTIQKLSLEEADCIRVTRYVRKQPTVQPPYPQHINYYPNIKTILSKNYMIRDMQFKGFSEQYPWEEADNYLSDISRQAEADTVALRFWRARFVLIPVEPPQTARRPAPSEGEENEEEIHLRGIRVLTQMWQKARFVPPDERRPAHNRLSTMKLKDRNPLRINLETLNPSELVATELDKLIAAEEAGELQSTQLLPEEDQFDRDSFSLSKLAQTLQGDRGIEIKTRRWHLRLHYSCFMGEDLTNWLVHNFRDIETRDEAVEIGNDLMKEGLFEHVNSRHKFKDGNYFYSIKPEWRTQRAENKQQSWFPASRKPDRSIPATPINEQGPREALTGRTRSASSLANQAQVTSELAKSLGDKKKRAITLSKMIRIDVDTRKRSNRPEIVNLHYDRLHNPENCYHLELAWLNVTSKLVDDAIVNWTTQAEKYGLKLVEVPIAEASRVPDHEPFRAPYRIKLALEPPQRAVTNNVYFTATSFGPQAPLNSDVHLYQKALLKRFNFVLDLEATSEFPENVEIRYSWGTLDYRYTQFVHRSGVGLAQITDEGDILLLANRLYNSRLASGKDTSSRMDSTLKKEATPNTAASSIILRPPPSMVSGSPTNNNNNNNHGGSVSSISSNSNSNNANSVAGVQASGIIGLNVASPRTAPFSSPLMRPLSNTTPLGTPGAAAAAAGMSTPSLSSASGSTMAVPPQPPLVTTPQVTADVFGAGRQSLLLGGNVPAQYITPEQIKDDLEALCHDRDRLEAFYREVAATLPQVVGQRDREREQRKQTGGSTGTGGTSSSLLRPVKEVTVEGEIGIPEFKLPEAVTGRRTSQS
ncbi:vacuolar membrane-associated protein iml1 [Knufia peltigerae]|uniref:Vacuolar membrane-associated protein IML1 n=1 Tax=Knufia peltigerae TaxID=1002370 RepID=A0AA38XPS2_9EURO|nr:vacuolar membrane-associated protein iml1 [Knufia peltigerae]